eukprot:TRINITY_DN56158_c0_g1_i1.p1 TRINITY_DN56158_c0_g1~~TRINITY_DN56158_c0_g1_i1.p1  ORF type:complete len:457 (+),score=53.41 TRINITY_DN56158_c0_g1_i1:22-1371(+)
MKATDYGRLSLSHTDRTTFLSRLRCLFVVPALCSSLSPSLNMSRWLADCSSPTSIEARFVCSMECSATDPVLTEALGPWWDIRFTKQMFDEACEMAKQHWSQAYQAVISNQRLFFRSCSNDDGTPSGDLELLMGFVRALCRVVGFPDAVFNFNIGDQPFVSKQFATPFPQFHWVMARGFWSIPFPTPQHMKCGVENKLGDGTPPDPVPWNKRTAKVFWRGSFSIPDVTPLSLVNATSRFRLLRLAIDRPDVFDVGITGLDQAMREFFTAREMGKIKKQIAATGKLNARPVEFREVLAKFKYAINVGAVLSSWRLPELLGSGALLFLQESADMDLVHARLAAWVHYVPVRHDLSDLAEKVDYMVANDHLAQQIASAGFAFFKNNLTRSDMLCYMWRAIRSVTDHSDWMPGAFPSPKVLLSRGFSEVDPSISETVMTDFLESRLGVPFGEL